MIKVYGIKNCDMVKKALKWLAEHNIEHVVEDDTEVAQAPHAGLGADGRQARLQARVAQGALLGLAGGVVEVDLLVGGRRSRTCASRGRRPGRRARCRPRCACTWRPRGRRTRRSG